MIISVPDFRPRESAVAFLIPALFISAPLRQRYALSATAFNRLLMFVLLLGVATVAVGATYNFRFVAIENINYFRDKIESPDDIEVFDRNNCPAHCCRLPLLALRQAGLTGEPALFCFSCFCSIRLLSASSPFSRRFGLSLCCY